MPKLDLILFGQQLTSRHLIMMALAGLLVLLNIWHWWPVSENGHANENTRSNVSMAPNETDFLNYIPPGKKEVAITRNLFVPVPKKVAYIKPAVVKKNKQPVQKNTPDPQAVFSAFKLEGVLDTEGKVQAFLSRQDDVYMVYKGERVFRNILVEKITHDGILLKDESNGATHWVMLGGE